MNNGVRWKQRFQNFEKAYLLLDSDIQASIASMSDLEKAGVIQHFEIVIELSWKLLKDYLEYQGRKEMTFPKNVIRQAFQDELINNPELWMEALEERNKTSHTYEEKILEKSLTFIEHHFYPLVKSLYFDLKKEL